MILMGYNSSSPGDDVPWMGTMVFAEQMISSSELVKAFGIWELGYCNCT